MKIVGICILLLLPYTLRGQHTFSITAVDSATGMVGSAGASCLDTTNSYNINRINATVPGVGVINAQASWDFTNLANGKKRLQQGDTPDAALDWLMKNDSKNNPRRMQYGIAILKDGKPLTTAYSGSQAMNYKNHAIGHDYTVQGNVLIGQQTIDGIEQAFLNATGSFTDRLMKALQGANFAGADRRCLNEGVSCRSAYIRVALPTDQGNTYYLDLYVGATPYGVEPIDELQKKYDAWNATTIKGNIPVIQKTIEIYTVKKGVITVTFSAGMHGNKIVMIDSQGRVHFTKSITQRETSISMKPFRKGVYFIALYNGKKLLSRTMFPNLR